MFWRTDERTILDLSIIGYARQICQVASSRGTTVKDMQEHLEKLQAQIVECEIIRDQASDPRKRELFARLAEHHRVLALEIKRAIGTNQK